MQGDDQVDSQAAQLFDLWEYNQYLPYSQLYDAQKVGRSSCGMLLPMLRALTHPWEVDEWPVCRQVSPKSRGRKSWGPG